MSEDRYRLDVVGTVAASAGMYGADALAHAPSPVARCAVKRVLDAFADREPEQIIRRRQDDRPSAGADC